MSAFFDALINILWVYSSFTVIRYGFRKNNMLGRITLIIGGASMGLALSDIFKGFMA